MTQITLVMMIPSSSGEIIRGNDKTYLHWESWVARWARARHDEWRGERVDFVEGQGHIEWRWEGALFERCTDV